LLIVPVCAFGDTPLLQDVKSGASAQTAASSASPTKTSDLPTAPQAAVPSQVAKPPQPVGTAAAPELNPEGIPASRPAGAAIAAAKQKRIHTFMIRTAIVVGAAVAIGVVVAASSGSPSRAQ